MAKRSNSGGGIVYSTDPSFSPQSDEEMPSESLLPAEQKLRIKLETKQRGGKAVTVVENYVGPVAEIEELGKKLKTFCGTGGAVKDGCILVQGDNRDKILQWLLKQGFKQSKKNG